MAIKTAVIDGAVRQGYWTKHINGIKPNGKIFLVEGTKKPFILYPNLPAYKEDIERLKGVEAYCVVKGTIER